MALATRCPHCHTTFRVAQDQLKLRAGLVRCGACKEIFNGIEHLLRPDTPTIPAPSQPPALIATPASEPAPTAPTAPKARDDIAANATPSFIADKAADADAKAPSIADQPAPPDASTQPDASPPKPDSIPENSASFDLSRPAPKAEQVVSSPLDAAAVETSTEVSENDPLTRMTLMDFTELPENFDFRESEVEYSKPTIPVPPNMESEAGQDEKNEHDPIAQAIDDLRAKPTRSRKRPKSETPEPEQSDADDTEEPGFVRSARRKQRTGRVLRIAMMIASVFLISGLIAQGTFAFRNQIALRFPQTKPALTKACALLGCQVGLPTQIDNVSIESSDLQVIPSLKNSYTFTGTLRNRSSEVQAWPDIELTLNDVNDKPVARRVFKPRDYVPAADLAKGFAPTSEQSIKLIFEVTQLSPSGYRVYLFYS
jgi:predicted Zn finger-like uncharacterized protein